MHQERAQRREDIRIVGVQREVLPVRRLRLGQVLLALLDAAQIVEGVLPILRELRIFCRDFGRAAEIHDRRVRLSRIVVQRRDVLGGGRVVRQQRARPFEGRDR